MSDTFQFLNPESNPHSLSGYTGGDITNIELVEGINYLFSPVDMHALPAGYGEQFYQYRKLWIKQSEKNFATLYLRFSNIEYTGNISFANTSSIADSNATLSPTGLPSGYFEMDFTGGVGGVLSLGTGSPGDSWGIWIRQTFVSGHIPDSLSSFGLIITTGGTSPIGEFSDP